jgi:hypothetical protein
VRGRVSVAGGWCCEARCTGNGRVVLEINARVIPRVAVARVAGFHGDERGFGGVGRRMLEQ